MIEYCLDSKRLDMSGGRTVTDKITESLLTEFSDEHGIKSLTESKRFEHFACYVVVKREHPETFDTHDIVVGNDKTTTKGSDTGVDGIAVIVNGVLITDVEELEELAENAGHLDVVFIFIQAETSSGFDGAKIGTFGFGVSDFFRDQPQMQRSAKVSEISEIVEAIYKRSSKFKRGNPICKLFYVTTGKWMNDANLLIRMEAAKTDLSETGRFRSVEFTSIGADGVQKMYQKTKNAISAEFIFANRITITAEIPGVTEAYFGFLP